MTGDSIPAPRAERDAEATSSPSGDLTLLVRRVRDLITGSPVTWPVGASVVSAARLMSERAVGSVIVLTDAGEPAGILTDRDLRTRVLARGLESSTPVGEVMSSPLVCVAGEAPALDALFEMTRRNIHHLGVSTGGRLTGVVSSHDLLGMQAVHPVVTARQIETARDLDGLAGAAGRVEKVVRWLVTAGAEAADIGRLVAELNDRLVRRALDLVQDRLDDGGHGRPSVAFSWLVAGSEGRREQTLKTDQDNALVYEDPPSGAEAPAAGYFARLGTAMGEALTRLGFPRCPGDFMASNPQWRQPESVWRGYFDSWMASPRPEPILRASLFFDMRPVGGNEEIGRRLGEWVSATAPTRTLFLRHMARAAVDRPSPLGLFGRFVVERAGPHKDRLDLKAHAVLPITHALRVYALSLGLRQTNTLDRLHAAGEHGILDAGQVSELRDAYRLIARLRLAHQIACLDAGHPVDNFISPRRLGRMDRLLLKEALRTVAELERGLAGRFRTDLVGS